MKLVISLFSFFFFLSISLIAQSDLDISNQDNELEIQRIIVEKGQTLNDFIDFDLFSKIQTDIDPGVSPEGDFMLRSAFTKDGSKVLVCTGGTDNITVFDFETMTPITVIDGLNGYPVDVATTDEYAIVGCLGSIIYVIDLSDYSIVEEFGYSGDGQAVVVETSPDGNYAYVALDVSDQLAKIDLVNMEIENTFFDFPISLLSFSWVSTGGRSSFKFTRFKVSPDGSQLIVGNADNAVEFINTISGTVDYSVTDIPNCFVVGLSGDGTKTIALSDDNNVFNVYQIDNATHEITGTVSISGNYLACYDVAVNQDGSKAFIGIGNNSSAIVRFETSDFVTFSQTYTPFWMTTSFDHQYAISGQYRFSIMDFDSETMVDQLQGHTQDFGCVSPVENKVIGYDPLRYEGVYFFDFVNPSDIQFKGKSLVGSPPEADTPYRIAISKDGTKAITSNSLSESMTIIDLTTYSVEAVIDLGEKCDAVGITHDSQYGIMGGYDMNTMKLIDLNTNELITSVTTGQRPLMVEISLDDQYAYIGNLKSNSISIVELDGVNSSEIVEIQTGTIGLSWAAFGVRSAVVADPTDQYILVAASFNDIVQVVDIEQQQIVAELAVGTFPLKIAFNASGNIAAVTNYNSDNFSLLNIDGASSSVIGTYPSNGDGPLRLAYNEVNDEFGIIIYSSQKIINVDAETGVINSTDNYAQYGNPSQIMYDAAGNAIVLVIATTDDPGYLIRKDEVIVLPATPTYFDYCSETHTAVVCMPGPDYVSVIEFDQLMAPDAEFEASITNIYVGQFVDFNDLSLNEPDSWAWEFEGGTPAISSDQNPSVVYDTEGTFDVSLTATNSAGTDTELKENYISVLPWTNTIEMGDESEIKIFPNPVFDKLQIQTNSSIQTAISFALFNSQGKLVMSKQIEKGESTIDLTTLPQGLYFLKLSMGEKSERIKLFKKN